MIKKHAIQIILIIVALVLEESHQLFKNYPRTKVDWFLFSDESSSVQWYVHDLSNCLSAVLIGFALRAAFVTKNMRDIAAVYIGYRFFELIAFVLWDKQFGYTPFLILLGIVLYIIISQWKKT